jgi:hypothetical protein
MYRLIEPGRHFPGSPFQDRHRSPFVRWPFESTEARSLLKPQSCEHTGLGDDIRDDEDGIVWLLFVIVSSNFLTYNFTSFRVNIITLDLISTSVLDTSWEPVPNVIFLSYTTIL